MDNGSIKEEVVLNSPSKGLLIDNMLWHEMYDFTEDCIVMVVANEVYQESDYIRDYTEFLDELHK
jgi:dTDP-4-dehydrorhamnose 3,5-epimerase-like enzyme